MTRLERVNGQITRTKAKITELTERLKGLERQKNDMENVGILKLIHGFNVSKDEVATCDPDESLCITVWDLS